MKTGVFNSSLVVVAGELSGDRAAARVVTQIKKKRPCHVFGIGGDYLKKSGVDLVAHIGPLSAIGLTETLSRGGRWARVWADLREAILHHRPAAALLVDAPELNLPLARILTKSGTRVIYYIGPQVWAWRKARLGLLKERVEVVALVLPFEKDLYDRAAVPAKYVGHPIVDEVQSPGGKGVRECFNIGSRERVIALLPGSREGEISRHGPAMMGLCEKLLRRRIVPVLAPPPGSRCDALCRDAQRIGVPCLPETFSLRDLLRESNGALVVSGTATLEVALEGVPMAILYKLDTPSYLLAKFLFEIPYVGLPNWIAGRKIVPELIQHDVEVNALDEMIERILEPGEQERQKTELKRVAAALGPPGVAGRVAAMVLERLP